MAAWRFKILIAILKSAHRYIYYLDCNCSYATWNTNMIIFLEQKIPLHLYIRFTKVKTKCLESKSSLDGWKIIIIFAILRKYILCVVDRVINSYFPFITFYIFRSRRRSCYFYKCFKLSNYCKYITDPMLNGIIKSIEFHFIFWIQK